MSGLLKFGKNAAVVNKADTEPLPISGTPFTVDILEVLPSRLNPRLTHGTNYQEHYNSLKDSIRNIGLQTTLTVTKYPDSEQYELYNGGNTRLTILTELYHEYQENGDSETANRYRYQQVIYTAFTDELDVLVKHMVENEERINMTFIDKARAIFQIKALYLQKTQKDNISNRQLTEYITQLGWSGVRHQAMTDMHFAFEKLDSVLPLALNSGMGKPKIQQLRLWLNTIKKYVTWLNEKTAVTLSIAETERLYFKVLNPFDDDIEPINIDAFYQTFIISLSDHLQAFEPQLKPETITFALSTIEQLGAVPDNFSLPNVATPQTPQSAASDNTPREQQQANHHGASDNTLTETDSRSSIPHATEQPPTIPPQDSQNSSDDAQQDKEQAHISPPKSIDMLAQHSAKKTQQLFEQLLSHCHNKKLHDLIVCDNDQPPFYYFHLRTEQDVSTVSNVINHGQLTEKYVLLHCLAVAVLYQENHAENHAKHDAEQSPLHVQYLSQQWHNHAKLHSRYVGLCQTGLITRNPKHRQAMQQVHQLCLEHLAIIHAVESALAEETHAIH